MHGSVGEEQHAFPAPGLWRRVIYIHPLPRTCQSDSIQHSAGIPKSNQSTYPFCQPYPLAQCVPTLLCFLWVTTPEAFPVLCHCAPCLSLFLLLPLNTALPFRPGLALWILPTLPISKCCPAALTSSLDSPCPPSAQLPIITLSPLPNIHSCSLPHP